MVVILEKFVKIWTNFGNLMKIFKVVKKNFEIFNENFKF